MTRAVEEKSDGIRDLKNREVILLQKKLRYVSLSISNLMYRIEAEYKSEVSKARENSHGIEELHNRQQKLNEMYAQEEKNIAQYETNIASLEMEIAAKLEVFKI